MMSINNNDFLMGVIKKDKKKKSSNSNSSSSNSNNAFINELLKIQNSIRQESNITNSTTNLEVVVNKKNTNVKVNNIPNNLTPNNKKSFKNILLGIIKKLEDDVEKVSKQIQTYNEEKKSILEMDKKEILQLKNLTKKLYKTIIEIYTSLDVNKELRIELLEKLKKNIEGNKVFLKNINQINKIKPVGEVLENKKKENELTSNKVNQNKNKNKNQVVEEEKIQEVQEEVINNGTKSNLTIFNVINENKNNKNMNMNKNKNLNRNSSNINTSVNTVINNGSSNTSESEGTMNNSSQNSTEETVIQPTTLEEQIREKKINTSKKVSQKLNELNLNKNQSRTLLNDFLIERTGSSNIRRNRPSSSTQNLSSSGPVQSTPLTVNRRNNNIIL